MNLDIKLHKKDLPHEIKFSDKIAVDCEFTGLNINRDRLCVIQISRAKMMHILFNSIKMITMHQISKQF